MSNQQTQQTTEETKDPSTQQSNNGFEVLSDENGNSASRSDALHSSKELNTPGAQEANQGQKSDTQSPTRSDQSPARLNVQSPAQSGDVSQNQDAKSPQIQQPASAGANQKGSASPTKSDPLQTKSNIEQQKRPIHVPNYTAEGPSQSTSANQQSQQTQQHQQPQPGNFNPGQFPPGFNPQQQMTPQQLQLLQQQFMMMQQQLQAAGMNMPGQQAAAFAQMQMQMQRQPMFLPIIDMSAEYQKGNFLPALHCIKHDLIPRDYLDSTGYNIFHHAISFNNGDVVIALLDHFKFDVQLRSKTNQTSAMIAANFGFIELLKIVLDRGCSINAQDDTLFTAALYAIKQGNSASLLYLIAKGADLDLADSNGCTIVHWSAYKNNVFLLRLWKRLGYPMNKVDLAGFTPLQRAISAEAIDAAKYLIEDLGIEPSAKDVDTIANYKLKELILSRLPHKKSLGEKLSDSLNSIFQKHSRGLTFMFYFATIMLTFYAYYDVPIMTNRLNYIYHTVFMSASIYCLIYFFWYYMKSEGSIQALKKLTYRRVGMNYDNLHNESTVIDSSRELEPTSPYKQPYLDSLISKGDHPNYKQQNSDYAYPSFLHEIYHDVESGDFDKIALFDERRYCPTTLLPKKPKSKFCKKSNRVIEGFNHYSSTLGRPVDQTNHIFYFLMMTKQTFLLLFFLLACIYTCNPKREAAFYMVLPETMYHMFIQSKAAGIIFGIDVVLFFYSLFFWLLEVYCVAKNITYNELFNAHSYPYLYKVNRFAASGMQMVKVFHNPNDKGIFNNIRNYLLRSFQMDNIA